MSTARELLCPPNFHYLHLPVFPMLTATRRANAGAVCAKTRAINNNNNKNSASPLVRSVPFVAREPRVNNTLYSKPRQRATRGDFEPSFLTSLDAALTSHEHTERPVSTTILCAARSLSAAALVRAHWSRAVVVVRRAWANRISSVGEPVIRCSPIQHRQYGVSIIGSQKPRKDAIQDTPPRADAQSPFEGPQICPKPCGKAPRVAISKRTSVSRIEPVS
jgi:hypothetical protein